jgi:hypothetical protein
MLVQFIQGHVADRDLLDRQMDRWASELRPGAAGFLGSTWGFRDDGTFFEAVRFDSPEAAAANAARAEQSAWWTETEKAFDDVTFKDSVEIDEVLGGGSDDAGFVQVIEGRVKNRKQARAMLHEQENELLAARPDILGGLMAWHDDDGGFTQVMYFRTEHEARAGESAERNDDVGREYQEMMADEPSFLDLTEPHFL